MRWRGAAVMTVAVIVLVWVLAGCGASVEDMPEKSPKAVDENVRQPSADEKYQYANDGAVYVNTYENHEIEQWSLDGVFQRTYPLPAEHRKAYHSLLYVNNEELFYSVCEEAGDACRIMRVPIRQTDDGQELLLDRSEFLWEMEEPADCGNTCTNLPAFYANRDYIVWISSYFVGEDEAGHTGCLHVYDREKEKELVIPGEVALEQEITEDSETECSFSEAIVSVGANVCGDRVIFHADPLEQEGDKYNFIVYTLGADHAETIDERCYTGSAYITDRDRRKAYYQIIEDQSVWEYDCESGEKREMIPEQAFRSCYEENGLTWFPEEDDDSFFLEGNLLYIIKEKTPTSPPLIFSYSLETDVLQYEKAVTEKLRQCIGEVEQENGADHYFHSAITILEGKLLHYTDYEQYYCIDLKTAEAKRVYVADAEKIYFALMGELVEAEAEESLNIRVSTGQAVEIPDPSKAEGRVDIILRKEPGDSADCDDQEWLDGFFADLSFAGFHEPVFVSSFTVGNMTDMDMPSSCVTQDNVNEKTNSQCEQVPTGRNVRKSGLAAKQHSSNIGTSKAGMDVKEKEGYHILGNDFVAGMSESVKGNCLGLLVTEGVGREEDWEAPVGKADYLVVLDYGMGNCYRSKTDICVHGITTWPELAAVDVTGDGVKELIAAQDYGKGIDYAAYRCDIKSGRLVEIYSTFSAQEDQRTDSDWCGFTGALKDDYQAILKFDEIGYSRTVSLIEDGGYRKEDLEAGEKFGEGDYRFVALWKDGKLQKDLVDDRTVFLYTVDHVEHVGGEKEKPQVEFVRSVAVGHRAESIGNMHIYLQYDRKQDQLVMVRAKYVTEREARREADQWWG